MLDADKVRSSCASILSFTCSNWTLCLSVISFIALLAGCFLYGVSPLYTLKEVGYQQQQEDLKNDFVRFHNNLGTQFLYVEQFEAAKYEFNQVLKVDPLNQNATRYLFECSVFSNVGNESCDPEIINKELNALENENPEDPLPYLYLGDFSQDHDLYDDAIYFYQKAINLDSSVAAAYEGLGNVYEEKGQADLANEMFEKAVNLSYWNVLYRGNLACTYYELKDYQKALYWYNGSIILDPNQIEPYTDYSNSYRCLGDLESARETEEKQIRLLEDNDTESSKVNQGEFFYQTSSGNTISLYSSDAKKYYIYYNTALTYYLLGNENMTLKYVNKANDLDIDKDSQSNIKELLNSDIENLQEAQPKFINTSFEFKNKFE